MKDQLEMQAKEFEKQVEEFKKKLKKVFAKVGKAAQPGFDFGCEHAFVNMLSSRFLISR